MSDLSNLTSLWAELQTQAGLDILAGLAVLVTIVALGQALLPENSMGSRVRSHLRRRANLRADRLQVRQRIANLRTAPVGSLRTLLAAPQAPLRRGGAAHRRAAHQCRAGARATR